MWHELRKVCGYKQHPPDMFAVALCLFPSSSNRSIHALPALSAPNPAPPVQTPLLPQVWAAHVSHS